jgi:hypothetical protein
MKRNISDKKAKEPPVMPELYGPYDRSRRQVSRDGLARDTPYVFGAHTPHGRSGYGVRSQFDWDDGQRQSFDFEWPDSGMPDPSHSWRSVGEKTVRVRALYYNPSNAEDCSDWSAWNSVTVTVKK